ncbi:MAG TPA: hypothetical protein VED01_21295 [Burkholderiales bacterium]|nr:hypothetical protein [Burkholderiales bacterium]
MPFLSLTRLHLRAWYHLPRFMLHASRSSRQARSARGFIAGALSADVRHLTFWTATLWENEPAMRAFQVSGAHKQAMPKLGALCDEASVVHIDRAQEQLPSGEEAVELMRRNGRISRLTRPSPAHAAGNTVPGGRPPRFAALPASS